MRYPSPLWVMPGRGIEPLLHHQALALDPFTAMVAMVMAATMKTQASVMDFSIDAVPISAGGNNQARHCTWQGAITHLA